MDNTFKRETYSATQLAALSDEKDELQRQYESLMSEKQTMMVRMAQ